MKMARPKANSWGLKGVWTAAKPSMGVKSRIEREPQTIPLSAHNSREGSGRGRKARMLYWRAAWEETDLLNVTCIRIAGGGHGHRLVSPPLFLTLLDGAFDFRCLHL